jgi:cytosine/adenosine deaminase-related metal-dependent hydrolase
VTFQLRTSDGAALAIKDDRIVPPDTPPELTVELGDGLLLPGLINAHDHLHRNHYPRLGSTPYRNVYEWGEDLHSRFQRQIAYAKTLPRDHAFLFGALKNLLGGVTTVVHHDPWVDLFDSEFPLRVARLRMAHTLRLERDLESAIAGDDCTRDLPLTIHLAEGTDDVAGREVRQAATEGLLTQQLIAVHVVGIDSHDVELLGRAGAAVVWCPSSNEFLYGRTAPASLFDSDIDILLGTDSLASGTGTLLDELRAARSTGYLDARRLTEAVGAAAARRLGIPLPSLEPGSAADVILLRKPLFEARSADVALVVVAGRPVFGDAEFGDVFALCEVPTEPIAVGGIHKLVVAPVATIANKVIQMFPECGRILD